MNWALVDAGAFDFAADQKAILGRRWLNSTKKDWALRGGYFLLPDVPNGNDFDTRIFQRGQYILEFEDRYTLFGTLGKFRLTGWEASVIAVASARRSPIPFLAIRRSIPGRPTLRRPARPVRSLASSAMSSKPPPMI